MKAIRPVSYTHLVNIKNLKEEMPFIGVLLKKNQDIDVMNEIKAVSYTHLDVYKRQDTYRRYVVKMEEMDSLKLDMDVVKDVLKAVSYTHLDVYKRQG